MKLQSTSRVIALTLALGWLTGCVRGVTVTPPPAAAAKATGDATKKVDARLLETGKAMFMAKCGSCHDADGSKALASGPPLNQRALTDEVIADNIAPRLRKASAEEKRALAAYIRSFLKPPAN